MCYSTKVQTFRKLNTALFYVHFSLIICFVVTFCFRKSNLPATHAALALQFSWDLKFQHENVRLQ